MGPFGPDLRGAQNLAANPPSGPGRLAQLLARPGIQEALLAVGSRLMAQSRQPGSLGSALGQALPAGVQAYQQGQQQSQLEQVLANAPPSMQRLIRSLPRDQQGMALMQIMGQRTDPVTLGKGDVLVDPTTGEQVAANPAAVDYEYRNMPDGTVGVFSGGEMVNRFGDVQPEEVDFDDVSSLRKEFNNQIEVFDQIAEAYNKVEASGGKANPTAADDVSLLFGYMKIVDPGSTVREGEQATARNAGGIPDRLRVMYNSLLTGEMLSPQQRANFVQAAKELVQSQESLFNERSRFYRGVAERNGFEVADVIRNPFAGIGLADPLGIR